MTDSAGQGTGGSDHTLTVVVNGDPAKITANENQELRAIIQHALKEAEQSGRPASDWELRAGENRGSEVLEPTKKLRDYGISLPATLFLSLRSGGGGSG